MPLVGFDIETDTTNGGLEPTTAAIVAAAVSMRWVPHPGTASSSSPTHDEDHPADVNGQRADQGPSTYSDALFHKETSAV
ncbi:MAG: hypothetical protein ACR2OH_06485, partial [Microthrixaceae bacterium]